MRQGCHITAYWALLLLLLFPSAYGKNLGHRVGAGPKEYFKNLPENSIAALRAVLLGTESHAPLQDHKDFIYLEFDVQETADGELVLFHDSNLTRLIPKNTRNKGLFDKYLKNRDVLKRINKRRPSYKDLKIQYLTLNQLKSLALHGDPDHKIPTLEEFLNKCMEWGLKRPLTLEVKKIVSDQARQKLIDLLTNYRVDHAMRTKIEYRPSYNMSLDGVNVLAFERNFKKSYGKKRTRMRKYWCRQFANGGFFQIYRAIFHRQDLCH